MKVSQCELCIYYGYDSEIDDYTCSINMDMDEIEEFYKNAKYECQHFRMGNDYTLARKQGF